MWCVITAKELLCTHKSQGGQASPKSKALKRLRDCSVVHLFILLVVFTLKWFKALHKNISSSYSNCQSCISLEPRIVPTSYALRLPVVQLGSVCSTPAQASIILLLSFYAFQERFYDLRWLKSTKDRWWYQRHFHGLHWYCYRSK